MAMASTLVYYDTTTVVNIFMVQAPGKEVMSVNIFIVQAPGKEVDESSIVKTL